MKKLILLIVFLVVVLVGCQVPAPKNIAEDEQEVKTVSAIEEDAFKPFVVYQDKGSADNHFSPSGFMPNGKCLEISDAWQEDCYEGKTCIKFVYDIECSKQEQQWVGVYWLNPANNWGGRKGGFNLEGASRLTFWARGEKGGERIEEFSIGGIDGEYADSDMAIIGPVILTDEWNEYIIDLRGKDLSYISGGFTWTSNVEVNPESCVFYLDNIQFE
ncbi:MAG: hypothetical protein KAR05_08840 [Candidatus Omnitrophica bacterium]|nr:hypothetical protein [Candidatus Omnitrophota bacterium]